MSSVRVATKRALRPALLKGSLHPLLPVLVWPPHKHETMSKRLLRDLQTIKQDTEWGFTATPDEANLSHIIATFPGPVGSPYEGGVYAVSFDVPNEYPLKPPRARFATRVFHPNISSQTGAICLDILKDKWTPVYNLQSILISLQQLLDSPNADDPQDAEVAKVYTEQPVEFRKLAHDWAVQYAQPPKESAGPAYDEKSIATFVEMGFPAENVKAAFHELGITKVSSDEDVHRVSEKLL